MMDMRELKGLEIAAQMKIVWENGSWTVPSQSGTAKYRVTLNPPSCTCEDFTLNQKPCKHVHAARQVQARDYGGKPPVLDMDVIPKRPTYKQKWPAYNLAQTTEKRRFQELLADLCWDLPDPPQKMGRPKTSYRDVIFAMAFKVYSTVSTRRFACDLQDAHRKGYISKPIHYNSICAYLENPDLTPLLHALIERSSLPLKEIETDFALDSTGFSTSRFVRWYDEKYGTHRSGHDWVKVHIATGVRTNVITAVVVGDRNANDCPQFPELVKATAKNFTVREASGDKAYLSRDNLELVARLGGTAFIPFKSNSVAGEAGTLWEKMFLYYQFKREEFLAHYHKRSNAESTFNMIKAKFRDHVRSRTDTAMANEVLCKVVCHNLCVLIQSQCELGIEPLFWSEEPVEKPDVLPMIRPG